MSVATLIYLALFAPVIGAGLIALSGRNPNLRETVTLATSLVLFATVMGLLAQVLSGARPGTASIVIFNGVELGFSVEPLGMIFAVVASGLWIVNSIYSIGYMRGYDEPRQTSFYVCFAIAIAGAIGVSFAGNLFTLFLFYEILTLSTYPLVAHRANAEAIAGGRIYLLMLLGTSMGLLLPAIIWTGIVAGTLDFMPGGILAGKLGGTALGLLLALYIFGIGKAAVMPVHSWLPAAMVAPTPVSALLHAVAVVKAGVFTVVKVIVYVFGIDLLSTTGASEWLVFVAAFSLLMASLVALTRDNLKARLAYSTVSQLAYVVLGAALATQAAIIGSGMQIVMHATGKITLFFCAGAIAVATHKTEISDMVGIGRRMPVTMFAFLIGSLSIIGLPPVGGTWSKWWLGVGAVDAGHAWVVAVLMVSSLLNVAYLLPIVARGFFLPPPEEKSGRPAAVTEAPAACLIPLCITAALCIVLFFAAGEVEALLAQLGMVAPTDITAALTKGEPHGP
ncbi:MAG TPA: monovalent cation/H+ antiporter subunit D family protein [Afifellaceae bacterium]|nr:monovalent cation/H+ antiporter subunit D family protein [Afifellaceae bacterium]